jgi:hypothetical protein
VEYTEPQKEYFKAMFARRRRHQLVVAVPAMIAIVALILGDEPGAGAVYGLPVAIWAPALAIVVGTALVFSFLNWRCPACNRYLGRGLNPRFCPRCGVQLHE